MPYIDKDARIKLADPENGRMGGPGELNYALTKVVKSYLLYYGTNYQTINDIVGALEGAKLEFYRRVAAPYEDKKIAENGDVY